MTKGRKLLSEADVLNKLGATDFRSINKNQLIEFVTSIPEMDKEVAMKCIEQFPEFKEQSTTIVKELYKQYDSVTDNHKAGRAKAMDAYQGILDDLSKELEKSEITPEEKQELISTMIDVADKIANLQRDSDFFLEKVLHWGSGVAMFVVAAGAAVLGVKSGFFDKSSK